MGTSESLDASQGIEIGQRYRAPWGTEFTLSRHTDFDHWVSTDGSRWTPEFLVSDCELLGPAPEAAPATVFKCSRCDFGTDGGLCAACAAHRASKLLDKAAPALPKPVTPEVVSAEIAKSMGEAGAAAAAWADNLAAEVLERGAVIVRRPHDWSNPYCRLGPHVRNDIRLCVACGRSQECIDPDPGCIHDTGWRERWEQTISRAMESRKPPAPANQEAGSQRELARPQGHSLLCGGVFSLRSQDGR